MESLRRCASVPVTLTKYCHTHSDSQCTHRTHCLPPAPTAGPVYSACPAMSPRSSSHAHQCTASSQTSLNRLLSQTSLNMLHSHHTHQNVTFTSHIRHHSICHTHITHQTSLNTSHSHHTHQNVTFTSHTRHHSIRHIHITTRMSHSHHTPDITQYVTLTSLKETQ